MTRPNIIVILSDQLRRDALGISGDPNAVTPNIDALAREGVRFSAACSTFPICVPFRFSLMTGEYAHSRFVPAIEWRMSPAERTLADEYNEAGYETVYIGKWHLYGGHGHLPGHTCAKANLTPVPRAHQGRWQKWRGFELANNPFHTFYFVDDDPTPRPLNQFQTDGLTGLTIDYLRERKPGDKPFCCVLSVEPPHFPLDAPKELKESWLNRDISLPPNFLVQDQGRLTPAQKMTEKERARNIEDRKIYYAMIENLDQNVGRLRAVLRETGQADNTLIVFFSDHGDMGGAHAESSQMKDHPYEESVGIPLIVYDPRMPAQAGTVLGDPAATEDLYPTLLGLCGLRPRDPKPGADLSPLVRGEIGAMPREGVLLEFVHDLRHVSPLWFPYHEVYWRAFRSRRFKYTVLGGVEGATPWQFFDLENDPGEMKNLIDDPRWTAEIKRHHQLLRDRLIETGDHVVLQPAFGLSGLNDAWKR